jgi:rhodanese-related sulfurtransferase
MRKVPEIVETLDPHQEIIVVCHHGIRSRQVALFLEHHGFSNVVNLKGGLDAWARHTDTKLPTY